MQEKKEEQQIKEDNPCQEYVKQHGNWVLGLHYDREAKAYRRYDLDSTNNEKLELKYKNELYDKNGNVLE